MARVFVVFEWSLFCLGVIPCPQFVDLRPDVIRAEATHARTQSSCQPYLKRATAKINQTPFLDTANSAIKFPRMTMGSDDDMGPGCANEALVSELAGMRAEIDVLRLERDALRIDLHSERGAAIGERAASKRGGNRIPLPFVSDFKRLQERNWPDFALHSVVFANCYELLDNVLIEFGLSHVHVQGGMLWKPIWMC